MKLENLVIAITGAAQGLGAQIAIRLASQGAKLALIDLNTAKLLELKEELEKSEITANIYAVNVAVE